jgi:imidazole glycerol-phosphate synthase subunit HisH
MICIIDYGVGNVGSIANMIKKIGYESVVSADKEVIQKADKLILPGVGSFDYAISKLEELNLFELLNNEVIVKKKPILGICLGMQLMTKGSDEGRKKGFSWIDAFVYKLEDDDLKMPHMGWNLVKIEKESQLSYNLYCENRFYFVHSYFVHCENKKDILFSTNYSLNFTSGFVKDNIYGVQFHPEKSHKFGKRLLENFCRLSADCAQT